jgi:hypothetical protein
MSLLAEMDDEAADRERESERERCEQHDVKPSGNAVEALI